MSVIIKKILVILICVTLGLLAVYLGIFCATTLAHALTQPHLESEAASYSFLGYYIMSGVFGFLTLLSAALSVAIAVAAKKKLWKKTT